MLVLLGTGRFVQAQAFLPNVVASDGEYAMTASGSISWTLGEVMTETFSDPSNVFTQGFQQPRQLDEAVINLQNQSIIKYYPNPASTNLFILTANLQPGNYTMEVFNIQGVELHNEPCLVGMNQYTHNLSIAHLPNGMYLVRFYEKQGNFSTTFKFTKAD